MGVTENEHNPIRFVCGKTTAHYCNIDHPLSFNTLKEYNEYFRQFKRHYLEQGGAAFISVEPYKGHTFEVLRIGSRYPQKHDSLVAIEEAERTIKRMLRQKKKLESSQQTPFI